LSGGVGEEVFEPRRRARLPGGLEAVAHLVHPPGQRLGRGLGVVCRDFAHGGVSFFQTVRISASFRFTGQW
jgi:hypothetical protein